MALGGGEAAARLFAFAATVYLARTLTPSIYGIFGAAMGIMLYLTQLADGGIELVGVPLVARARDRVTDVASPVLSARFMYAVAIAVLTIAVGLTLLPQPDGAILAASAVSLLATGLSTRWIHLGLERAGAVAMARTVGELAALILIVLLVHDAGGVALVPVAQFVGASLTSLLLLVALSRLGVRLPWSWAPRQVGPVFARARHLVGFTLLGLLLFNFDLIYLRFKAGAEVAGYYAAAYTLISFAANLIVAFAHTVLPTLTRLEHDPPERNALFERSCAQALALALPVGAGAWYVATQTIDQIFGAQYLPGVVALQWLAWSIPLAALRELPIVALIAAGREGALLRINSITVVCNIVLVVSAVPRFGLAGAAAATTATELIRLALAAHFARRQGYPILPPARLVKATVATAVMTGALVAIAPGGLWTSIPLGAGAYALGMVLVRGVRLNGRVPVLSV
jgi:O-antigen/teichoic acid export membrane protein